MKLPIILAFIFILIIPATSHSQDTSAVRKNRQLPESSGFSWDKVSVGGGFWIDRYQLNIAPVAGYMVKENIMAGVGGTYLSFSSPYSNQWLTIYGGKVFGRYFVLPYVFIHGEIEELFGPWDPMNNESFWVNTSLIGGGYRQNFGGRFFSDVMVLFNLNDHLYSPYRNPVIRMGFSVGL